MKPRKKTLVSCLLLGLLALTACSYSWEDSYGQLVAREDYEGAKKILEGEYKREPDLDKYKELLKLYLEAGYYDDFRDLYEENRGQLEDQESLYLGASYYKELGDWDYYSYELAKIDWKNLDSLDLVEELASFYRDKDREIHSYLVDYGLEKWDEATSLWGEKYIIDHIFTREDLVLNGLEEGNFLEGPGEEILIFYQTRPGGEEYFYLDLVAREDGQLLHSYQEENPYIYLDLSILRTKEGDRIAYFADRDDPDQPGSLFTYKIGEARTEEISQQLERNYSLALVDGFRLEISNRPDGKKYYLDLASREDYIARGVYNDQGQLLDQDHEIKKLVTSYGEYIEEYGESIIKEEILVYAREDLEDFLGIVEVEYDYRDQLWTNSHIHVYGPDGEEIEAEK